MASFVSSIKICKSTIAANRQRTLCAAAGPTAYAINGQRLTDKLFLLDGIGDNENHNGLGVVIFPPIDAVEEFASKPRMPMPGTDAQPAASSI